MVVYGVLYYNLGMNEEILYSARLPWPVSWHEWFGREAPLCIEIGFGNGQFLLEMAKRHLNMNWLGVEISAPSLRKAAKKARTAGLTNVRVVQGNAWYVLWALCAPQSVQAVYLNFPDPWPKERHHHRRLIQKRFLDLLGSRIVPGGLLEIATDHAEYAAWITAVLQQTPWFYSRTDTPFLTDDPERTRTKYELKALAEGRICHYYKWQRNDKPVSDLFPVPEEFPMPHVILRTPLTLSEIAERFQPVTVSEGDTHVHLMEIFESRTAAKLLVEAYVKEEPMNQRVGLVIEPREDMGDIRIGLGEVGFPRPTRGIQVAIRHLAEWVVSLHPATEIAYSNLGVKTNWSKSSG
ncbi:MAG: tRNA (guanosine(46)-N7)-methyltransferase TrmB [Chloroflexi bacterium]|nr:MAG: tRNA (guanosine(46)-N7)-methyltransferase TrmB [Chloroflexota bacterium]